MRFLVDECLHESLIEIAHEAGFEASHVNHLGLSGTSDRNIADRIVKDEFTLLTNNRVDFLRLFGKMELHPGLIVFVPNAPPKLQRAMFEGVLRYLQGKELINSVLEVHLRGKAVECVEYLLSGD